MLKTNIHLPKNLIELAKAFKKQKSTLYIVGGYIRNAFLSLPSIDIDICANLTPDKVIALCDKLNFKTFVVNRNLGTLLIRKDDYMFEYTCFRTENYAKGGSHSPITTKFVEDIKVDAGRRDFTINALYYDILKNKVLDFYNGLNDIKTRTLKAIKTPEEVFESDGLRILRFVRFLLQYNLIPDNQTLLTAKNYNFQLQDISKERILKELKAIVIADYKYNLSTKYCYEELFNYLDLYKYIFNNNLKNLKLKPVYDKKHIIINYRYIFFALQILTTLNQDIKQYGEIELQVTDLFGRNGIKDAKESVKTITDVYFICQFNTITKRKTLIKDNKHLITVLNCFNSLSGTIQRFIHIKDHILFNLLTKQTKQFAKNNIPLTELDLNVSNLDLINYGVEKKFISKIKNKLLEECFTSKIDNNKSELLKRAKVLNNKFIKKSY